MKESFGFLPDGKETFLYTISCGKITAKITDYGGAIVNLFVPDKNGTLADVVLGHDSWEGYRMSQGFVGSPIGRCTNRIKGASFPIGNGICKLNANEGNNTLHSGPDCYHTRLWTVVEHTASALTLELLSPHGDQGYPGNAEIRMTYSLDTTGGLHIVYDAISDRDTAFNITNHSYFNLAGHQHTNAAMDQILSIPGRFFTVADNENIPTGELRNVEGTPLDFRTPKPIGRDIGEDYECLHLQGGFDHNFEVFCNPCAQLSDPVSGRAMAVYTDCPGIQFYAGNFLDETGKGGIHYGKRTGVALETQFFPDSVNHPEWRQPFFKAGERYHSETIYRFTW